MCKLLNDTSVTNEYGSSTSVPIRTCFNLSQNPKNRNKNIVAKIQQLNWIRIEPDFELLK